MSSETHPPSCTCREHPLPASMGVHAALDAYLSENGFTKEAYDSATTTGSIFGRKIAVPNPPSHQRAIRLHDLQHVATGFGTDHPGEAELAAWQARRGIWGMGAYVAAIIAINVTLGLFIAPRRMLAAFKVPGSGGSLFVERVEYERLLGGSVGELRDLLGIPAQGLANLPRRLHAHAPGNFAG